MDFGRELYIPWRICQGDVLYRDLAYFSGPFAPYVNAGLFRAFGPGLMVLACTNLVVAALIAALLFVLLKRIADQYSSTLALYVFTTVFLFSRLTSSGNYNYLCPYSHEATYSIALLTGSAAAYALLFGAAGFVALRRTRRLLWLPITALVVACGVGAWSAFARPLPLAILVLAAAWRKALTPARAAMLVFSFLLLAKIILNVRVWHYGFTLAMPATMLLVVLLTAVAPTVLAGWGRNGALFRRTGTGFLAGIMAVPLVVSVQHWQQSSTPVGRGLDRFLADDERGRIVQAAVEEVANRVGPEETLLVMPEGVMINYLARRRNPPPYVNFMPPEVLAYGEADMVRALEAHPLTSLRSWTRTRLNTAHPVLLATTADSLRLG